MKRRNEVEERNDVSLEGTHLRPEVRALSADGPGRGSTLSKLAILKIIFRRHHSAMKIDVY